MSALARKALVAHRRKKRRQGLVRLEVSVRKDDAPLVRQVAVALNDPARAGEVRAMLRRRLSPGVPSLKELLAAAPIDGLVFERDRDTPRDIEL